MFWCRMLMAVFPSFGGPMRMAISFSLLMEKSSSKAVEKHLLPFLKVLFLMLSTFLMMGMRRERIINYFS